MGQICDLHKITITEQRQGVWEREGRESDGADWRVDSLGRLISRETLRENREPFKYAAPLSRLDMSVTSDPIRMQIRVVARERIYWAVKYDLSINNAGLL